MYIDLKWENTNTGTVTTNIYRGTAALDRSNLGTPIATFTNKTLTYRDNTVTQGTTYYYVIEFVSGADRVTTRNFVMTANYTRGHGNATVVVGNDDYGVMDQVTMLTYSQLIAMVGIPPTGFFDTSFPGAMKFSYKGKVNIVLIASLSIFLRTYGDLLTFINQPDGIPITVDGIAYKVKLLSVMPDDWTGTTAPTSAQPMGDMLAKFIASQIPTTSPSAAETLGKINALGATLIVGRDLYNNTIAVRTMASNTITWYSTATTTGSTVILPILLELVE